MKQVLLILALLFGSCLYAQKQAVVGTKSFVIPGDKVIAYEELGLYAKKANWVEVYLHISKDSITVTELQSETNTSKTCTYIFIYRFKRSSLNYETIQTVKYDLIQLPENLLKVEVSIKENAELGTLEAWGVNGSLGATKESGFRVIVASNDQALEIINLIKGK